MVIHIRGADPVAQQPELWMAVLARNFNLDSRAYADKKRFSKAGRLDHANEQEAIG